MKNQFNRFDDQCEHCTCYFMNMDEDEIQNMDVECSLEQKTHGTTPCDFFDDDRCN